MINKQSKSIASIIEPKHCIHPALIEEYAYGGPTGNFICVECESLVSNSPTRPTRVTKHTAHLKTVTPLRLPAFIV
ncbi:hypothetical protein [Methylomonas albis]|nr:hypothetical protein [Methylomonas albis]